MTKPRARGQRLLPLAALLVAGASVAPRAGAAAATAKDLDLAKLIECRASMAEYHALGDQLGPDLKGKTLGWKPVEQASPFFSEFQLPRPIKAFGRSTTHIALAGSGVLAILDGVKLEDLAAKQHLKAIDVGGGHVIFARVVSDDSDDVASIIIRLNASTVTSHPGKVLAGCEYRVEVK